MVACALVVASLLYPLVACVLGMISLPCQVGLVACVLVVAFLPLEEVCHQWKQTPIEGVRGDDHVMVASLPYLGLVVCVLAMASLPY